MLFVAFVGLLFLFLVRAESFDHQVEIHFMTVELGSVHADELGFSVHLDAAAAAHAGPVDHDCVERNLGRYPERQRRLATELHHQGGADDESLAGFRLSGADLLEGLGDQGLAAVRAVVGANDQLIADIGEAVLQDHAVLVTGAED